MKNLNKTTGLKEEADKLELEIKKLERALEKKKKLLESKKLSERSNYFRILFYCSGENQSIIVKTKNEMSFDEFIWGVYDNSNGYGYGSSYKNELIRRLKSIDKVEEVYEDNIPKIKCPTVNKAFSKKRHENSWE